MTKILSVLPSANSMTICILEDNGTSQNLLELEKEIIKLESKDENVIISQTVEITQNIISEHAIDEVVIAKAGTSKIGKGASSTRHKIEAMVQFAALKADIKPDLIAPQSIAAYEKKLLRENTSVEQELSIKFSSKDKKKVATQALYKSVK